MRHTNYYGKLLIKECERLNNIYKTLGFTFQFIRKTGEDDATWVSYKNKWARIFVYFEGKEIGFIKYGFNRGRIWSLGCIKPFTDLSCTHTYPGYNIEDIVGLNGSKKLAKRFYYL